MNTPDDILRRYDLIGESGIERLEEKASADDSLFALAILRLISALRSAFHSLEDPNYLYAGTRIHRQAILCREATIDKHRERIAELERLK